MTPFLARQRTDRNFERLYQKHAGDVYRYALVVLRNEADAEDVTQTTFMNAYRAFANGERPRTPQNWLIAIAHNVCRQRFRQSQRRPNEVQLNEELAESFVEDDAISAEDIRRALGHLAFNQRAALVMRELEGRSYQEIGEILEVSVSAVETGLAFKAAAFGFGALLAGGVGYEGVRHTVWKPAAKHATVVAAATKSASNATPKSLQPSALGIDHRPFRQASINARRGRHGRPAVSKVHPAHPARGHGATAHRPAHARVHKVKPVRTHPPTHNGQTKTHRHYPPPKKPKPPHANKGKGNGGTGQPADKTHGKSG